MLNFHFSEKCLGLVSPPHFAHGFLKKKDKKIRDTFY